MILTASAQMRLTARYSLLEKRIQAYRQRQTWCYSTAPDHQQGWTGISSSDAADLPDFQVYPDDPRYNNAVSVTGNLGADPEMTKFSSGNCVVRFPLALHRGAGEDRQTEWLDIESWGPLGRRCVAHFTKGAWVGVHGRLKIDKWTDKATQAPRKKVVIVANEFFRIAQTASIAGYGSAELATPAAQLWQEYGANPEAFWDNRGSKRNPNSPDFVHKVTRAGLWLDSAPPGMFAPAAPY